MKYTKKPVTVEALQWDGTIDSAKEITDWIEGNEGSLRYDQHEARMVIHTLEGNMGAKPGDYIIRGLEGEFYPCDQRIFNNSYREYTGAITTLDALINLAGETAENSGWHEGLPDLTSEPQNHMMWINTKLMLVVSEVAEAVEELRAGHEPHHVYYSPNGDKTPKPEGFPVEIVDVLIRLFDLWWTLESAGWDMPNPTKLINDKLEMNATARGYKHGGKSF